MRKIISIVLILAMLSPNLAKWLAYSACKIKQAAGSEEFCVCSLGNLANDNNASSFPDKQKEITAKTDWKYLAKDEIRFIYPVDCPVTTTECYPYPHYTISFILDIFHPPCFG